MFRTVTTMVSVLLVSLLALLAPLQVAAQCTPLGVDVEFVAPSDSGHVLVTNDSEVAKSTALCHVACLNQLLNGDNGTNSTDAADSAGMDESAIELGCFKFEPYLDCRYGCVLQSQGESDCVATCSSRCMSLCGFFNCFGSHIQDNYCGVECTEEDCSVGCGLYDMITAQSEDLMAPMSGPNLVLINGTHAYKVAIPEELIMFDTPSLVFQIEDQSSPGDYVYQWMVDVQFDLPSVSLGPPVVDLAAYSCRTVSVSYAFATTMGLSEYSIATEIDVRGNQTECTVSQLEDSDVRYIYVPDDRVGFFTHSVWNVAWNLSTCHERVTGFTVSLDPEGSDCGEHLRQTVDSNTSSVSLRSTEERILDLPCTYVLRVQVNPREQGSVYTRSITVSLSDFVLPELEIVGCPVMYNRSLNGYEVNFQWKTPFSPAGLSFIRYFQITVLEMQKGHLIPLATYSPEFEHVNSDYDPLHNYERKLHPYEVKDRFYRFVIEVVWNGTYSKRDGHCDTVDTLVLPPDPIENIYNTHSDLLDVLTGRTYQAVEVTVSFSWDEPELNYNVEPIQQYQAHLAREPLDPGSEGDAIAGFSGTSKSGSITRRFEGINLDVMNFTIYLQMRSYQFENLPSNWSQPYLLTVPISTSSDSSAFGGMEPSHQNILLCCCLLWLIGFML